MKRLLLFALFALAVTGWQALSFGNAQTASQSNATTPAKRQLYSVSLWRVKPDTLTEFESFVKNERNPLLMKGGVKTTYVWRPELGDRFEYTSMRPIENFAALEANPIRKALPANGAAFQEHYKKLRTYLTGAEDFVVTSLPDLSYASPKQQSVPTLATLTKRWIAPFRTDYDNYLQHQVKPAYQKADWSFLVSKAVYGGDINVYYSFIPMESYTARDGQSPLTKALGSEAAQLLNRNSPQGAVLKTEQTIIRYRADLSITAGQNTAAK